MAESFVTSFKNDLKPRGMHGNEVARIHGITPTRVSAIIKGKTSATIHGKNYRIDRSGSRPLLYETDPPPSAATDDLSRLSGEALRDEHERIKTRLDKLKEAQEVDRIKAEQKEADAAAFRELAETLVERLKQTPYWEEIHELVEEWKNEIED